MEVKESNYRKPVETRLGIKKIKNKKIDKEGKTMKKIVLILIALTLLAPVAYSADNYVVGKVGVFVPNDLSEGTKDFDNGPAIGVSVGRMINKNLSVELGVDYTRTRWTELNDGYDPNIEINTIGVPLVVKLYAPLVNKVNVFSGFGIGCYYSEINMRGQDLDERSTGYTVGYQAVAGADYMVTDKIAVTGEVKYTLIDQKGLSGVIDGKDVQVGGVSSSVGVKYLF